MNGLKGVDLFSYSHDRHGFKEEAHDLIRGIAGGLIFGMPVLYTMEVWNQGKDLPHETLIIILTIILAMNILFSYFAGLRERHSSQKFLDAIDDGVTALGLALILSAGILTLIGQLDFSSDPKSAWCKIILEASIMSMGVTFTNFKFRRSSQKANTKGFVFKKTAGERQSLKDLNDLMAAVAGSFVYSFNVAPTEEIILIASSLTPMNLVCLVLVEIFLCYIVLYASGIKGQVVHEKQSFFQKPFSEVILTWSVAFLISGVLIIIMGFGGIQISSSQFIPSVTVLALPAVIGASAGRLVV